MRCSAAAIQCAADAAMRTRARHDTQAIDYFDYLFCLLLLITLLLLMLPPRDTLLPPWLRRARYCAARHERDAADIFDTPRFAIDAISLLLITLAAIRCRLFCLPCRFIFIVFIISLCYFRRCRCRAAFAITFIFA